MCLPKARQSAQSVSDWDKWKYRINRRIICYGRQKKSIPSAAYAKAGAVVCGTSVQRQSERIHRRAHLFRTAQERLRSRLQLLFLPGGNRKLPAWFAAECAECIRTYRSMVYAWNPGAVRRGSGKDDLRMDLSSGTDPGAASQDSCTQDQKERLDQAALLSEIRDFSGICDCDSHLGRNQRGDSFPGLLQVYLPGRDAGGGSRTAAEQGQCHFLLPAEDSVHPQMGDHADHRTCLRVLLPQLLPLYLSAGSDLRIL